MLPSVQVDTIGSTVIVRHPPLTAESLSVEVVTVGREAASDAGEPDEFGLIQAAVLTDDGQLVVADAYASQVRVFTSDGGFVRAFGRRGAGPGEYQRLQGLGLLGDTLIVLDGGNARMTLMSIEGEQYGTWRWFPISGPASMIRYYPVGLREGYVFGVAGNVHLLPSGPADTVPMLRPDDVPSTMLRCPGPDGSIRFFSAPFARDWVGAPAPGAATAGAWNDAYRITITSAEGDTLRVIERQEVPRTITDREWADATAQYEEFRTENPGATCTPGQMTRPGQHPIVKGLFHDQAGRLVVEVSQDQGSRFDFYDHEGYGRGSIAVPARDYSVAPHFRDDAAVVVTRDASGVQTVRVHRWRWRATSDQSQRTIDHSMGDLSGSHALHPAP